MLSQVLPTLYFCMLRRIHFCTIDVAQFVIYTGNRLERDRVFAAKNGRYTFLRVSVIVLMMVFAYGDIPSLRILLLRSDIPLVDMHLQPTTVGDYEDSLRDDDQGVDADSVKERENAHLQLFHQVQHIETWVP